MFIYLYELLITLCCYSKIGEKLSKVCSFCNGILFAMAFANLFYGLYHVNYVDEIYIQNNREIN